MNIYITRDKRVVKIFDFNYKGEELTFISHEGRIGMSKKDYEKRLKEFKDGNKGGYFLKLKED